GFFGQFYDLSDGTAGSRGHGDDDLFDFTACRKLRDVSAVSEHRDPCQDTSLFAGVVIDKSHHLQGQAVVLLDLFGYDGSGVTGSHNEASPAGGIFAVPVYDLIPENPPVYARTGDEEEHQSPVDQKYAAGQVGQ